MRRISTQPRLLLWIDRYVGSPLCLLFTAVRGALGTTRPSFQPRSILFLKLAEQGSTVLAYDALAEAVARVGRHRFPVELTATVRAFLEQVSEVLHIEFDLDDPEATIAKIGPIATIIGATVRNTANPTRLAAGYKDNVIPGKATATIDCRTLPGQSESFERELRAIAGPDIELEYIHRQPALETTFDGHLVETMSAALRAEDPGAVPVPYMLSGGTDAKQFDKLGIRCFGFSPLRLPADLNFGALFHGIDERVPLEGLQFGVRVLDRFIGGSSPTQSSPNQGVRS
jgi:hypothetical protein